MPKRRTSAWGTMSGFTDPCATSTSLSASRCDKARDCLAPAHLPSSEEVLWCSGVTISGVVHPRCHASPLGTRFAGVLARPPRVYNAAKTQISQSQCAAFPIALLC